MRGPAVSNGVALGLLAAVSLAAWGIDAALPPYLGALFLLIGINAILAVSLNLVNGVAGQFSLGHAGFMALGAYTAAWLSTGPLAALFNTGPLEAQAGLACTVCAGALVAGLAGWLVGLPSLRLKGDYLAIVTLGFGEIIRVGLLNSEALGGARGFIGIPPAGGAAWIFGLLALACLACHRVMESSSGRALLSVRENETAAEALGVDTTRCKVGAFAASAAWAGVAGALFAHQESFIYPGSFDFMKSVEIVVMVVLGGMGSMSGALLAAAILTALPEALRPLKELTGVDLRMVLYSLALVLLMIFRPGGLLGRGELWTGAWARRWIDGKRQGGGT
ncbi:MAG TPA: branched-chain amino acid ABC transporter permease [bacterium]|jgi:branched-chain amino acid transport system permease protein|nr:branched-chain amino acid ABC transporter permease [bacterium]